MISSTHCGPFEMTAAVCCSEWWCHYVGVPSLIDIFGGHKKWENKSHDHLIHIKLLNKTELLLVSQSIIPFFTIRHCPCPSAKKSSVPGPHSRPTFLVTGRDFGVTLGRLFFLYSVHIWAIPECVQVYQGLLEPTPTPTPIPISTTLQLEEMLTGLETAQSLKKKKKRHHCPLPHPILRV